MKKLYLLLVTVVMMVVLAGCSNAQQGSVIGGVVGAGTGYVIGNEMDK